MVSLFLTCAPTWLSLIAGWCLMGETPRGQPWTPALMLPHGCYGLSVRRLTVLCSNSRKAINPSNHRNIQIAFS